MLERREPRVRDRHGQADVELQSEWPGELVGEEPADAAVPLVDPSQQLALVEAEADRVVGVALAGRPRRPLAGHDRGQPIGVGDDVPVHQLVERK